MSRRPIMFISGTFIACMGTTKTSNMDPFGSQEVCEKVTKPKNGVEQK